jgi:2-polyprenyl-3-methyl-5-hydroxy-6-metoxy-1,4-benzoquinol methylase
MSRAEPFDYYDAEHWAERTTSLLHREKLALALLADVLTPGARLLDVGCGNGIFLDRIRRQAAGVELTGVDYSKYQVERPAHPSLRLLQADLGKGIPLGDRSFDVVYAAEIIEHVLDPDFLLGEIRRVLRPGGTLVLSTPNLCAWYNRALFALGVQPLFVESSTRSSAVGSGFLRRFKRGSTPVGHVRIFTLAAIRDLLASAGFSVTAVKGASFDYFPRPLRLLDAAIAVYPRLSSDLVVKGRAVP